MASIFSIHYFLWYGALTSIFGYESVYARIYTNSTPMQYGYLNMVLPFMTVLVTPVICSMADRQRSHRSYFTLSLVIAALSIFFYTMLPLLVVIPYSNTGNLLVGPWVYYCLNSLVCDLARGINTCLSDSFAVLQAEETKTSFGRIIVWGTFGWAATALTLGLINQWSVLPPLVPGLIFGSLLLTVDVVIVSFWPNHQDFKLDKIPISAAQTLTGSAPSAHRDPSDYQPLNEAARINLGIEYDAESGNRQMRTKSPVRIAIEDELAQNEGDPELNDSVKTINSDRHNSDSDKPTNVGKKLLLTHKLPPQTVKNSTIPGKHLKTTKPFINDDKKNSEKGLSNMQEKATSFRMQFLLLGMIMWRRKSLIRYLILFVLSGFFMSMHWNYFFLYLEQIYHNKFAFISALSMVGQSILGELPFFILSRKVIDYCGRSHTLSISMISIGIRFLLYAYLLPNVSMYYIVVADCFQGPNYGLFYVVMTEVGLEYSYCDDETIERLAARGHLDGNNKLQVDSLRLSLRSTVQSVAFACYEGLGVGLGSLTGGWIVGSYGFKALWLSMAVGSISVGLINVIIEFFCPEFDPEQEVSEQREFMQASRRGVLRKLASPAVLPLARPASAQSSPLKLAIANSRKNAAGSRVAPPAAEAAVKRN